jgi:hypothetical protein
MENFDVIFINKKIKFPTYSTPLSRRKTFLGFEEKFNIPISEFVEAGFYLQSSELICYYCGLTLENYASGITYPSEVHAICNGTCPYLLALFDKTFILKVRQKYIKWCPEKVQMEEDSQQAKGKCIVCLDKIANILYMPCRHLATCGSCKTMLEKCPVCRAICLSFIRIYPL